MGIECNFKIKRITYTYIHSDDTEIVNAIKPGEGYVACYLKGGVGACDGEENCALFRKAKFSGRIVKKLVHPETPFEDFVEGEITWT